MPTKSGKNPPNKKQTVADEAEEARLPHGRTIRNLDLERRKAGGGRGVLSIYQATNFRRARRPLDDEAQEVFLEQYARTANLKQAAILARVSEEQVRALRRADPVFDLAVTDARAMYDFALTEESRRRAIEGVTEPIIGGQFKDEIVAYKQNYSDGLLARHLDAQVADMRKEEAAEGGGGGGVLIVPNRVDSLDDWERAYGEAARGVPS